jgi:hypothetical protein
MKERFCSLIVLGPSAPCVFKLHLSRSAIVILVLAFLFSFLAVIWVGYTYPSTVDDLQRAQLEAENRNLQLEASLAAIGLHTLDGKMTELEAVSKRINEMVEE